jgi:flavin reductase (DIM6/NTAB) family NADH-FMN oxidoreductase RutF/DNA-binding IclR family transcriptional regulator
MTASTSGGAVEGAHFRQVLGQYPTGVCVVSAIGPDGRPVGLSVGSFASVSLDPPLVAFMPDKRSSSWPKIRPAGAFCVNVLSVEQEGLCRVFASKAVDKFAGVAWRPASSGSPVIEGAVAWIDCDLERVDAAGDHEIVLGRVRDLGMGGDALPLLFFRGGYGRFAPMSMAANDGYLSEQLRIVDLARAEMETAAAELDGQVAAWSIVGDSLVLVARAGDLADETAWSAVGQRVPLVPPIGTPLMAWQHDDRIEAWLGRVDDPATRELYRMRLTQARDRGYSVMLDGPHLADMTDMINNHRLPGDHEGLNEEQRATLRVLPFDPLDFSEADAPRVRTVNLPVIGSDGTAPVCLGIRLAQPLRGPAELRECVARMRAVTEQVSHALTTS